MALKKDQLSFLESFAKVEGARAEIQGAPMEEKLETAAPRPKVSKLVSKTTTKPLPTLEFAPRAKVAKTAAAPATSVVKAAGKVGLKVPKRAPVLASHVAIVPPPSAVGRPSAAPLRGNVAASAPVIMKRPAGGFPRITAWSFSRYKDWVQCPLKARLKHVERMKEPGNAAMERGSAIHKLAEDYANRIINVIPPELEKFRKELDAARRLDPICEAEWGFRQDWTPTGWFGKDVWCRVKTDLLYSEKAKKGADAVLCIVDHKTGEPYPDHADQLSLYALSGLIKVPTAEVVRSSLWYLDNGARTDLEWGREQLPALMEEWNDRTAPMMNDTTYQAKPNNKCQWCHFRKNNGGPCQW